MRARNQISLLWELVEYRLALNPQRLWSGSCFEWMATMPLPERNELGENLVAGWLAAKGFDVERSPDSQADRIVNGRRAEIRFSTLWRGGFFKFQQFRDQDYDIAICLGVSPFDAHCWAIDKRDLFKAFRANKVEHQHGGKRGTDTWWFTVQPPDNVPSWLVGHGGRLTEAFAALKKLAGTR